MSKPRTQEELDQYYRELADYVDAGIQNWKRRYEPRYVSDQVRRHPPLGHEARRSIPGAKEHDP